MDVREKLVDIVCDPAQINGCIHRCNHPPCAMVGDIARKLAFPPFTNIAFYIHIKIN